MVYIHQHPDWPSFEVDKAELLAPLGRVRRMQGELLGRMKSLGFELTREAEFRALTAEVIHSAAIEGEKLNPEEVRSSLAKRLGLKQAGLPTPAREVDGIVQMMLDATQNADQEFSKERLWAWHSALFPSSWSDLRRIVVGEWRKGPMQVVSGPIGREKVHFEAPSAEHVHFEMRQFFAWVNQSGDEDPVLASAIAHLWFVTIHPFDDGNGRIARAISDLFLTRADGNSQRFYSLSSQLERERQDYYDQLEQAQKGGLNITPWLLWYLGCLERAFAGADQLLEKVLRKARVWDLLNKRPVNDRQRMMINRLLEDFQGKLTSKKYAKIAKCSRDTAIRDLQDLIKRGAILQSKEGGRSTSYELAPIDDH